jgi:hypothetical protein
MTSEEDIVLLQKWHGLDRAPPQTGATEVGSFDDEDIN